MRELIKCDGCDQRRKPYWRTLYGIFCRSCVAAGEVEKAREKRDDLRRNGKRRREASQSAQDPAGIVTS